ncbi:MAG: polysaccharide deacetylase family protein [Quadrisphaera sp.]
MSGAVQQVKRFVRRHSGVVGSVISLDRVPGRFALTYDDGPEPGGTDRVLEVLAQRGVTATFFVLVGRARREPGLLAEVVAGGHEVALHGLDHRALTGFSREEVLRRTRDGRAALEDLTGREVRWVRPPYGRQTLSSWRAVRAAGLEPVMWGGTTWDNREATTAERVGSAVRNASDGLVLLAHDGFAGCADGVDDGPAPQIDRGDLARRVLDAFDERGLRAGSVAELEAAGGSLRRGAWFGR